MSLSKDNILTIGSMEILKGTSKPVMIVGFAQVVGKKMKDYSGVLYPLGLGNDKRYLYFNSEDIERVVHYGYSNDEDKKYRENFADILGRMDKDGILNRYDK